jgi:hypothetical protein
MFINHLILLMFIIINRCRIDHTTLCCEFDHVGNAVFYYFFQIFICFGVRLGVVNKDFLGFHMVKIRHEYIRNRRSCQFQLL